MLLECRGQRYKYNSFIYSYLWTFLDAAGWVLGAGKRSRTPDLMITNQLLYQLSYAGVGANYREYGAIGKR
jgi:hypothetical protein